MILNIKAAFEAIAINPTIIEIGCQENHLNLSLKFTVYKHAKAEYKSSGHFKLSKRT
jgi:hypothetical protein